MAEATAVRDVAQESYKPRDNSALFGIKHEDMQQFNSQIKDGGRQNTADMHHVELYDSSKAGKDSDFPEIRKPVMALDPENTQEIAMMVDHAFYTNNPKDYALATKNIGDLAAKHFQDKPLNEDTLREYGNDISNQVKAENKGITFELKDGKIVTHVSELLNKQELAAGLKDGSVDPKTLRLQAGIDGTLRDMAPAVTTEVPKSGNASDKTSDNEKVHNERPAFEMEGHILKPNDGKLIDQMVERQAKEHDLSPENKQQLQKALKLVAGSDTSANVDKLGQMTEQLYTNGDLKRSFQQALEEMGYEVKFENRGSDSRSMSAARDYAVTITEPSALHGKGNMINLEYKKQEGMGAPGTTDGEKLYRKAF